MINLSISILLLMVMQVHAQEFNALYFSAPHGEKSNVRHVTINNPGGNMINITGTEAAFFHLLSRVSANDGSSRIRCEIQFSPDASFKGIARGFLEIGNKGKKIGLVGLSTTGLEGNHEATLGQIFRALDITTDPGWSTLANHTRPDLQGDEVGNYFFKKAGEGPVEMIPVARYSPPYALPFGYYLNIDNGPQLYQVGILSDSKNYHEHQTLMPSMLDTQVGFDPANKLFGLYVESPTHTSYTEDQLNRLKFPDHVAHAVRIYPVKDLTGNVKPYEYLLCFEEASNGDYQDYVFLIKNVVTVIN